MKPRIYRGHEIDQYNISEVGKIFDDKSKGMKLEDFFSNMPDNEMPLKGMVVIVGGRDSIEPVCRKHHGFRFRSVNLPLLFHVSRHESTVNKAAKTAAGFFTAPFREAEKGYQLAKENANAGYGSLASNLKSQAKFGLSDLKKAYGSSQNLENLVSAFKTRYTFVHIFETNDGTENVVYAGQIATAIEQGG